MKVLVDSSVWIDYFRGGKNSEPINNLIEHDLICTNELILTELIPSLVMRRQYKLISILNLTKKYPIKINWNKISEYRIKCLKAGINNVGIPDLIILENTIQNNLTLFSFDKHFVLMNKILNFQLF